MSVGVERDIRLFCVVRTFLKEGKVELVSLDAIQCFGWACHHIFRAHNRTLVQYLLVLVEK